MTGGELPMDVDSVILQRTSVRSYRAEPVSEKVLESLVNIACHAPSWMNKQCWHFIIVTDTLVIQDIAKTSLTNHWMKQAPSLVMVCADPHLSGTREGMEYYLVDAAIAMDHLILSAASKGLGSCWIGSFNEEKIKDILGIPPRIRIVALTPLGYPKEKQGLSDKVRSAVVRSTKRKSLSEICHWNQW
jgi:nitroreductase